MRSLRVVLALIFVATVGIAAASLSLPTPADAEISQYYSSFGTSVVLVDVMLAWGAAMLFLMALKRFKPELKSAYRLLAFSALAVGLGLLVLPYIEYYGLWDNLGLNMATYLQYLVGAPLMYFGVRLFYKRLGLTGWFMSPLAALGAIALLALIHPLLPYDNSWEGVLDITQYNLFKIFTIIPLALYVFAAFMAARLRMRVGREYVAAFSWLTVGLTFSALNTLGIILIEVIGYNNFYYEGRAYEVPAILSDLCYVFAGYYFAAIGRPRAALGKDGVVTSIDIIVYLVAKASDKSKIDPYLDGLREVTAQLGPGKVPGPADQNKLLHVYLKVEQALITGDPLRTFSKEQLRAEVSDYFGLEQRGKDTFWPELSKNNSAAV